MGKHKSDKFSQMFARGHNRVGLAPQVPRRNAQQWNGAKRGK